MKAVFPCKGVLVLDKKDIKTLENFYKSKLLASKLTEMYDDTEYPLQVGNLNYLPPKAKVMVNDSDDILSHEFFTTLRPID